MTSELQRVEDFASHLGDVTSTVAATDLRSLGADLDRPGLYAWWVDADGSTALSQGLGLPLPSGLVYAGQAGATSLRSGRRSSNTLRRRLVSMHLGGRRRGSTFRRSLGAMLDATQGPDHPGLSESELSTWMHGHLRVGVVAFDSGDQLAAVEKGLLDLLDPPLNLSHRPRTPIRTRLSELRRLPAVREDRRPLEMK